MGLKIQKNQRSKMLLFALFLLFTSCNSFGDMEKNSNQISHSTEIVFLPDGAQVKIDGVVIGTTPVKISTNAGQILGIEITKEGYIPFYENISVPPSGYVLVQGALAPLAQNKVIAQKGTKPGWFDEEACFISLTEPYSLLCGDGDVFRLLYTFPEYPEWIEYFPSGILWSEMKDGRYVVKRILTATSDPQVVVDGQFTAAWMDSDKEVLLWGFPQGDSIALHLLKVNLNGSVKELILGRPSSGSIPEKVAVSTDGNWLVTKTSGMIETWQKENKIFAYRSERSDLRDFSFSPDERSWLAYIDNEGNLVVLDMKNGEEHLLSSNVLDFQWIEDGNMILYSKRTNEGSSIFKSYDIRTDTEKIMIDPYSVLGYISDFSLSKDGSKIFYGNRLGRLEIIDLTCE